MPFVAYTAVMTDIISITSMNCLDEFTFTNRSFAEWAVDLTELPD